MTYETQQKVDPQYSQNSYDYIPQANSQTNISNYSQPSPYSQPLQPQQNNFYSPPPQQDGYYNTNPVPPQQNFYGAANSGPYYTNTVAPITTTVETTTVVNASPQSFDLAYWNGHFSYQFLNLPAYGCDPNRVQQTFSHVGRLVFSNFTIPYILVSVMYLLLEIFFIVCFLCLCTLPWISMVAFGEGWYIGLGCTIGGMVVFIFATIILSVVVGFLHRNIRNKTQIIAQNYLQQEMTNYYNSFGVSFQFYYFTFAVYTRRNVRFIYKPRIAATITPR